VRRRTFNFFITRAGKVWGRALAVFVLAVWLLACGTPAPEPVPRAAEPVTPDWLALDADTYPRFEDNGSYEGLSAAIANSLLYLRRIPAGTSFQFGADSCDVGHLIQSLEVFNVVIQGRPSADELNRIIRERFRVYQAGRGDPDRSVLFTGYYEPIVHGSPVHSEAFPIPLHSRPSDMIEIELERFDPQWRGRKLVGRFTGKTVEPYPARETVVGSTDFNRIAPPIAWVRDEFDRFNLQVQGSGKVLFSDGRQLNIQFNGTNGRPYRSIGRLLIDQGHIRSEEMSMPAIRSYLREHPERTDDILNYNPRYVFFRVANHPARGALGVALTPRRSLAADRNIFPLGGLAFIRVEMPRVDTRGTITEWAPYNGFVLVQDTGSAITGPGRADFFWGGGLAAEVAAGYLKNEGQLFYLVLRSTGKAQ
jgi:membrane-bound lytic murein transglycosylase A